MIAFLILYTIYITASILAALVVFRIFDYTIYKLIKFIKEIT